MASWLNNDETYELALHMFPSEVKGAQVEHHGKNKGTIDVSIKQIRYFKPKPELGPYKNYVLNGETVIEGKTVIVSCWCYGEELPVFQHHPEQMVFELMGGELVPESWRKG